MCAPQKVGTGLNVPGTFPKGCFDTGRSKVAEDFIMRPHVSRLRSFPALHKLLTWRSVLGALFRPVLMFLFFCGENGSGKNGKFFDHASFSQISFASFLYII